MEVSGDKDSAHPASSKETCAIDDNDGWHVEALLGPKYSAPICTIDALVDVIVDRRHTSRLIQDLSHLSPIPSLRHLKRVCGDGRIIIRLADDPSDNECLKSTPERSVITSSCKLASKKGDFDSTRKRSFPDATVDCESSSSVESKRNDQYVVISQESTVTTGELFLPEEEHKVPVSKDKNGNISNGASTRHALPMGLNLEGLRGCLERVAVPASAPLTRAQFRDAQRLWSCNFHPTRSVEAALAPGAGLSQVDRQMLQAVLQQCLDKAKGINSAGRTKAAAAAAAAAVSPCDGSVVALALDAREDHPLQHAAMRLVDLVARTQGGGVWAPLPEEEFAVNNTLVKGGGDSRSYLCTGLDVVLTCEPCAMCAMALSHARARRVFFTEDNPRWGVLYSNSPPLHTLPGLNHCLQVFRVSLPKSLCT